MSVLQGMKVIDLTQVLAGPYCTKILADMDAEVIKVEKYPGGDDTRQMAPFQNGESYCFMMINNNKKGMCLNIKTEEGKHILYKLVKDADVFIENFRPGVSKKLGIDYETIKEINPEIIYCSISGYGQTGPYSSRGGFDIMAQGMSGIMSMTGEVNGPPVKAGIAIHDISAGITAANSILLAYIHKLKTGKGQYIDISLLESALAWTFWEAAGYFGAGEVPKPNGSRHRVLTPYQGYKTKDDYILIGGANQKLWEKICLEVLEKPEWVEDPRFKSNPDRQKHMDELEKCMEEVLVTRESEYWLNKLEEAGVPCGPILTYDKTMNHEHVLAREMVQECEHPIAGKIKMVGIPAKLSETPGRIKSTAPYLGQHNEEILKSLNFSDEDIKKFAKNNIISNSGKVEAI